MTSRYRTARIRLAAVALVVGVAFGTQAGLATAQIGATRRAQPTTVNIDVPRIASTRIELRNGMVALLHEDHSSPIVAVDVWYHVGSKDDVPGKRGLAHMYEHMMFEGSANVAPGEFRRIIEEAGSTTNASTNEDRTSYVSTVPSNMLETLLWLEADRMEFGATRLDSIRFERERGAVRSEYNRSYDGAGAVNGLGRQAIVGGLFAHSRYEDTPIGFMAELSTATVQDLRDFFDRHTAPNNAVIAIVGDFKTSEVRAMVETYFGKIPRRAVATPAAGPTLSLTKETRLVLEDRIVNASNLWLAWKGAATTSPDQLALAALSGILAGGANARLPRTLLTSLHIANGVNPNFNQHFDLEKSGVFQIAVFGRPDVPMTNIEVAVDSVLADIRDNGVLATELERWKTAFAVGSVTQLQSNSSKARLLAEGETYHHNPRALLDQIDAARRLTPADVQRVARKYLGPGRVVLSIVPAGRLDLVSKPNEPYVNVTQRRNP